MVATASELLRRATTLLLALFLWFHAIFLLDFNANHLHRITRLLHFTASEAILLGLLTLFSFLAASGFWKMLRSLAYIYLFPFVVLMYLIYWCALIARRMNRWFKAQGSRKLSIPIAVEGQKLPQVSNATPKSSDGPKHSKKEFAELFSFVLRPFRRFMLLWCVLLLVTTHTAIVWLCLIVVLVQLARKIFFVLKMLLFSEPWLKKYGPVLFAGLNQALAELAELTPDAQSDGLKRLWGQLDLWRKILDFLRDPYLMSRWAWVIGFVGFASIYLYVSALFSFAYFGIARVSGITYPWPDALVASLFIPFYVADLPKLLSIRLLGGIHCLLVLAIGFGTVFNFLRRRLDAIRRAADDLSDRLDKGVREKQTILEARLPSSAPFAPQTRFKED